MMARNVLCATFFGVICLTVSDGVYALPPPTANPTPVIGEIAPAARWYRDVTYAGSPLQATDTMTTALGYYYVCFYDENQRVCLARQSMWIPTYPWEVITFDSVVPPPGMPEDSHRNPTVAISQNDGRIHLAYGHFHDVLKYRISEPGAATAANLSTAMFSEERNYLKAGEVINPVTYPMFVTREDNKKLSLFWARLTQPTSNRMVATYNDDGTWTTSTWIIDGDPGTYTDPTGTYAPTQNRWPYLVAPATFGGTIHLPWIWREQGTASTVAHDLYFATSTDSGSTWKNQHGTTLGLPMTLNSNAKGWLTPELNYDWRLINGGQTAVDSMGNTHVVVRHDNDGIDGGEPNQQRLWHYVRSGTTWTRTMIPDESPGFDPGIMIDRTTKVNVNGSPVNCDTVYITSNATGGRAEIWAAQRITAIEVEGTPQFIGDWDHWTNIWTSPQSYAGNIKGRIGGAGALNLLGHRVPPAGVRQSPLHLVKVLIDNKSD